MEGTPLLRLFLPRPGFTRCVMQRSQEFNRPWEPIGLSSVSGSLPFARFTSLLTAICVTDSMHMMIVLIKLSAAIFYAVSLSILWRGMVNRSPVDRKRLASIGLVASGLHLVGALLLVFADEPIDFGLFTSGSLIFALSGLMITLSSVRKPVHALLFVIQPICILLIALSLTLQSARVNSLSTGVSLHILFSTLAYGVITIAAVSAMALTYASHRLKRKRLGSFGTLMPPLETIEKLLFEMILAGAILLTASILSGFIFVQDFLAQQLPHKTFFALLSWLIFAILLAGHHFFGWRGTRAMKWTITGFVMLLLAYAGSKLVLALIPG